MNRKDAKIPFNLAPRADIGAHRQNFETTNIPGFIPIIIGQHYDVLAASFAKNMTLEPKVLTKISFRQTSVISDPFYI